MARRRTIARRRSGPSPQLRRAERALATARAGRARLKAKLGQERTMGALAAGAGGVGGYMVGEWAESRAATVMGWDARIVGGIGATGLGMTLGALGRGRWYGLAALLTWLGVGMLASWAASPVLARLGAATFDLADGELELDAGSPMLGNDTTDFEWAGVQLDTVEV